MWHPVDFGKVCVLGWKVCVLYWECHKGGLADISTLSPYCGPVPLLQA